MKTPIDFYFDFASPYGYLAGRRLEHVARGHDRAVNWRPIILTEAEPTFGSPRLRAYAERDLARIGRFFDIPFGMPASFPIDSHLATITYYAVAHANAGLAVEFAKAAQEAAFAMGRDLSSADELAAIAHAVGADSMAVRHALGDAEWREKPRIETERAKDAGVVGTPFFTVDGEPFLGHHLIMEVEGWLTSGGW